MALEEVLVGLLVVVIALLLYIVYRLATSKRSQSDIGELVAAMQGLATDLGQLQILASDVKSFSQEFQALLTAPKLRGGLGELLLENLLKDALPANSYRMRHRFADGGIVDAVIESDRGLIPVDSKFPLAGVKEATLSEDSKSRNEAVRRLQTAALKHIRDIASKYILPGNGTVPFAIMYLPSQAAYEHLIANDSILGAARRNSVLLASPNTLYIFLRAILLGLQGKRMEEMAARVIQETGQLEVDAKALADDLGVLQGHLNRARNKLESSALPDFRKLQGRIGRLTTLGERRAGGSLESEREVEEIEEALIGPEAVSDPRPSAPLTEALEGLRLQRRGKKRNGGDSDADE